MKIFLLLLLIVSCTKESNKMEAISSHLAEKNYIEVESWKIANLKILEESPVQFLPDHKGCKEVLVQYDIELAQDCYENNDLKSTLDKNSVFKAVKSFFSVKSIEAQVYHRNHCLSDTWFNHIFQKEKEALKSKIGKEYCIQTKSLINRDCLNYATYTEKEYARELNELERSMSFEMSLMVKHKKGERFFKKERIIYCKGNQDKIIFP